MSNGRLSNDIQVRWEKENNGDEVEQSLYSSSSSEPLSTNFGEGSSGSSGLPTTTAAGQQNKQQHHHHQQPRLLRFIRPADGALVFEPFRASDFRPDVHSTSYRCVATSVSRGASVVSRDMQVRAMVLPASNQLQSIEVLDELVIDGSSALFKCHIPSHAQDYLQVVDWIEYPSESSISYQSSTLANAKLLFHQASATSSRLQQHNVHRRQQQQQQQPNHSNTPDELPSGGGNQASSNRTAISRYFITPKTGHLHIINVDTTLNYWSFKCRCKNKLTGELISSVNKGKLIVTGKWSLLCDQECICTRCWLESVIINEPSNPTTHIRTQSRKCLWRQDSLQSQLVRPPTKRASLQCSLATCNPIRALRSAGLGALTRLRAN